MEMKSGARFLAFSIYKTSNKVTVQYDNIIYSSKYSMVSFDEQDIFNVCTGGLTQRMKSIADTYRKIRIFMTLMSYVWQKIRINISLNFVNYLAD